MKKQTVVIIWAAALLLLVISCFGIYYFFDAVNNTKSGNIEVFRCNPLDIEEYSVSGKNGKYTLERTADGWKVEDSRVSNLDFEVIEKVMNSASNIIAVGTISKSDFSGFDTTAAKKIEIDVRYGEDCEIAFLGIKDGLCAFKTEDDRRIYTMYASNYEILTPDLDKLRISDVFEGLSESDEMPESYSYTDYEKNTVKVRSKTAAELALGKDNRFVMESPYKGEVSDEAFEQQITVKIPAIRANAFIKDDLSDLTRYGLDENSRAELKFTWGGHSETLYLGKNDGGFVYAVKKGSPDIFTVNSSLLEFLEIDPFFILDSGILKAEKEKIKTVSVKTPEFTCTISSTNTADENAYYYVNGKAANEALFLEITEKLSDIKFVSELANVPENLRDITVSVSYANGNQQSFSFVKINDKEYAAFIDGKAEFAVKSDAVSGFLEAAKSAVNNPIKIDEKG